MPRNYENMQVQFYEDEEGQKINIKGAEILGGSFSNFGGAKTRYTKEGIRFFNMAIPFDRVQQFVDQGINVKFWRSSNEDEDAGEEMPGFVKVNVEYNFWRTPSIALREGANGQWVELQENALYMLDKSRFDDVGLILKIHRGQLPNGTAYASLYLRNGFFTKHVNEPNAYEADMFGSYGYNPNSMSNSAANPSQQEELPFN